ncbi:MAG: trypsin-like peptidase domain-containing protein [Deltaproteobacteria bacterium]|nr:trypsin-like peptidase domain-containing protein [Deltaproteobacteria bacterium]
MQETRKTRSARAAAPLALALAGLCVASCGGDGKPAPALPAAGATAAPGGSGTAARPAGEPAAVKHRIPSAARVGSEKLIEQRARSALATDNLGQVKSVGAPPKSSTQIYRAVAPATVIIRVPDGLGSGVIIDPAGWVLTNQHVIASGASEDFVVKATVMLGHLSAETGAMERDEKTYDAEVYKADKLRDVALLKIVDPPTGLVAVPLAKHKPVPGDPAIALGHAGAGMLWALKSGEISALGKLSEHLAMLAQFKDDDEGRKAMDAFKKFVDSKNLGVVIQSTCNILPGDSGGPLVNQAGELVGLNAFARQDQKTGGLLNFHVHLSEIEKILQGRPSKPARQLPDPWSEGGGDMGFEDADLDGQVDVLTMEGRRPCPFCPRQSAAVFVDADQSSFAGKEILPALSDVFDRREFEAEMVVLQLEKDVFVWYDTENDGRFDVLLYDQGGEGKPTAGYRIGSDGDLAKSEELAGGQPFRPSLFQDAALGARFARIAHAAFPAHLVEGPAGPSEALPAPLARTGRATVVDLSRDGRPDALEVSAPFSNRVLIDLDQSSIPEQGDGINLATLDPQRMPEVEVSAVSQGTNQWVWYDTDDDGRFDLVLHTPETRLYVASEAWRVDGAGGRQSAPEHVGRKLFRPALLGRADLGGVMSAMVASGGLLAIMAAKDDGIGSFPDVVADQRGGSFELLDVKGFPNTVVAAVGRGSDGYLIDLDQNSLRGRRAGMAHDRADLEPLVAAGKYDAELAYFQRGGMAWVFYDTENKGRYDLVLVAEDPPSGKASRGFRVGSAGGPALPDPALAGSPLVRPSLLKTPPLAARLKRLAPELFSETMIGN